MEPEHGNTGRLRRWDELIVRFRGHLRGRVRRTLWRAGVRARVEEVEELTQDVCCRLLDRGERKLGAFRGHTDAEICAYLGRAAERIVLDHLRAARAQKRGGMTAMVPTSDDAELVPDGTHSPEERLLAAEERQQLVTHWRALLGPDARSWGTHVLGLALLGGWNSREIARLFAGKPSARAIDRFLREARRRLRMTDTTPN